MLWRSLRGVVMLLMDKTFHRRSLHFSVEASDIQNFIARQKLRGSSSQLARWTGITDDLIDEAISGKFSFDHQNRQIDKNWRNALKE